MDILELLTRCVRILKISTKPSDQEFEEVAKVTGLGILVIGIVGMVISVVFSLI